MLGLLAIAVASDLRARRIPNWLIAAGLVLAVLAHALALVIDETPLAGNSLFAPLAGLIVGGALLLPLYLLRACGAGDVKLLAMVGAFVGPNAALGAALYTLVAGGALSLAPLMFTRGVAVQTLRNLRLLLTPSNAHALAASGLRADPLRATALRLPYAVAIAIGAITALLLPLPLVQA